MNQPAKRENMRDSMPETAAFVDRMRKEWGAAHVDQCLRDAKAGKPDQFYAIENGRLSGTPFTQADPSKMHELQQFAILAGVKFAAFMRKPAEATIDGAH